MTLNSFVSPGARNKFCSLKNLRNESDVEQLFLINLIKEIGYSEDYLETKATVTELSVGKGKKRKNYKPDYICYSDRHHLRPVLVIDAKSPLENPEDGVKDAQDYASVIRRGLDEPKPDQYCIGSNGTRTIVRHYDRNINEYDLRFADFEDGNPKFEAFKASMNRIARARSLSVIAEPFEFRKPDTSEIIGIFEACHDIIWSREFESPIPAFWEFCKLIFIKLDEDRKLRSDPEIKKLIEGGKPIPREKVVFSTHYIARNEVTDPSPIATLFRNVRNELELKILRKEKKRIFEKDEEIKLQPLTIKRVVGLLEHYDLIRMDEDLNGRLFQTFLSATMRGKALGQFFTPRSLVSFMTDLAELRVEREKPHAPLVIDACCGTGGFLIEAMAKMATQLKEPPLSKFLTPSDIRRIDQEIKDKHLFGIDAGKDPPVARIARINMYLHGDGGSRIYFADSLDKKVRIEETLDPELKFEREELRRILVEENTKFDVALTNPPFAMRKKSAEADQKLILQEYKSAYYIDEKSTEKIRSSLKSNVMFLERYYDLLKEGGKLITVIDESILNTDTDKPHRDRLLRNFYVRAVISLPQWAFFEADSNVKTSILYLVKKKEPSDEQPHTFYARSQNIGYNMQKPDESLSDLPVILKAFFEFERTGEVPKDTKAEWSNKSKFFTHRLTPIPRRIDFEWLDPRHQEMKKRLEEVSKARGYEIKSIEEVCGDPIKGKTAEQYVTEGIPIIKLRNVTGEGINWNTDFVLKSFYDSNSQCHLHLDDVLVTSTGVGTIGRVDILNVETPCMTDGHVTTLRVKDTSRLLPRYLAYYMRSTFGQMQMERYTVGSTGQTELNDPDIKSILIIYPKSIEQQRRLINSAYVYEESALKARADYKTNLEKSRLEFARLLGL